MPAAVINDPRDFPGKRRRSLSTSGVVTLSGIVARRARARSCVAEVRATMGVVRVVDLSTVDAPRAADRRRVVARVEEVFRAETRIHLRESPINVSVFRRRVVLLPEWSLGVRARRGHAHRRADRRGHRGRPTGSPVRPPPPPRCVGAGINVDLHLPCSRRRGRACVIWRESVLMSVGVLSPCSYCYVGCAQPEHVVAKTGSPATPDGARRPRQKVSSCRARLRLFDGERSARRLRRGERIWPHAFR